MPGNARTSGTEGPGYDDSNAPHLPLTASHLQGHANKIAVNTELELLADFKEVENHIQRI